MELTASVFLFVCPLVFLAGLVDAIGGGGGLISLPAYIAAGLPVHQAIATNKMSSACGTALATARFARNKLIDWKMALPAILMAIAGSAVGANLSMRVPEKVMIYILYGVLPVAAFIVLNKHIFHDNPDNADSGSRKVMIIAAIASFIIGAYDGFYGPGTGTFLIIALTVFARMPILKANGITKAVNLTTNLTSLAIFLLHGQVLIPLGLAAAACNMAGGWLGAGLAMKEGAKIVRPVLLIVLALLLIKIIRG